MRRKELIQLRVTSQELFVLDEQAAARNISLSALLREKLFAAVVQTPLPIVTQEVITNPQEWVGEGDTVYCPNGEMPWRDPGAHKIKPAKLPKDTFMKGGKPVRSILKEKK